MEANQRAESYLKVLSRMAHALGESLQESQVVRAVLEALASALRARGAVLRLLGPDGDELLLAGFVGLSEAYVNKGAVRLTESGLDQRVLTGEEVSVPDVTTEPEFRYRQAAAGEGLRGMVATPFHLRGRVLGTLRVYVDDVKALSAEDLLLLRAAADLGALALEKVRLHQSLFHVAEALNSSLELGPMLAQVLERTVCWLGLKGGLVRLRDEQGVMRAIAACGLSERYLDKGQVSVDRSQVDQRALAGEVVVLDDATGPGGLQYPQEAAREGIRSVLAVPVRLKGKTLGVMRVYSAWPRHFGQVAIGFLTSVAHLVALAIEQARLYQSLQERYRDAKLDLTELRKFLALG